MRASWPPALGLAAGLLAIGAAAGVCVAVPLLSTTTPAVLEAADPLTSIPVTMRPFDDPRVVELRVESSAAANLTLMRSGTITQWACRSGAVLRSGESALAVDGVRVLNLFMEVPPWRDLTVGSSGADVRALERELVRLDRPATFDGTLSAAEMRALEAVARAAKVSLSRVLPRDLVMWLAAPAAVVESCDSKLGDVVQAGAVLARAEGRLTTSDVELPADRLPGSRDLRLLDEPVPLGRRGELPRDISENDIRQSNAYAQAAAEAPDAAELTLKGTVVLREAVPVAAIPATALLVESGGGSCVFVSESAVTVDIVGSELGSSFVTFEAAPPAHVDAAPPPGADSCG